MTTPGIAVPEPPASDALQMRVGKLEKINQALMNRVEKSMDFSGGGKNRHPAVEGPAPLLRERNVYNKKGSSWINENLQD